MLKRMLRFFHISSAGQSSDIARPWLATGILLAMYFNICIDICEFGPILTPQNYPPCHSSNSPLPSPDLSQANINDFANVIQKLIPEPDKTFTPFPLLSNLKNSVLQTEQFFSPTTGPPDKYHLYKFLQTYLM